MKMPSTTQQDAMTQFLQFKQRFLLFRRSTDLIGNIPTDSRDNFSNTAEGETPADNHTESEELYRRLGLI